MKEDLNLLHGDGCKYAGRRIESCFDCPLPRCRYDGCYLSWEKIEKYGEVKQLRQQGVAVKQIATLVGLSRTTVGQWLKEVPTQSRT